MSAFERLFTTPMLWRSAVAAFVVGGLLFLINHDASSLVTRWTGVMWRQLGISMLVPFVVSLTSAVLTRRELLSSDDRGRRSAPPSLAGH